MTVSQVVVVLIVVLVAIIEIALWNEKVAYFGGWSKLPHTLFGTDTITKLREGLWIISSPGGFNPSTNLFGTAPVLGHIKLWCSGDGVWSPARVRAIKRVMREENVNQLSDFLMGHPHPDHIGGLPDVLKLASPYARIFTSNEDAWHLTDPCGSMNLPQRMQAIMHKSGATYLDWPLNRMYWIYPVYAWHVFGRGACGIDRNRVRPINDRSIFRFNGYYLRVFKLGGHSPGEMTFVVQPDDTAAATIVLAADIIDLTDTGRQLVTPMPLPEGRFVAMTHVLVWLLERSPDILVVEHGGLIRGRDNIQAHLNRVLSESNRIVAAVKQAWPARRYSEDFRTFAIGVFQTLGYNVIPALTGEEMTSIVASIADELTL